MYRVYGQFPDALCNLFGPASRLLVNLMVSSYY
jgi:hypothetical protein